MFPPSVGGSGGGGRLLEHGGAVRKGRGMTAPDAQHIGQLGPHIARDPEIGQVPAAQFLVQPGGADHQPGLHAALHIHDGAHIQGQVEQGVGKAVGFQRFAAMQEKDLARPVLGHRRDQRMRRSSLIMR